MELEQALLNIEPFSQHDYILEAEDGKGLYNCFGKNNPGITFILPKSYKECPYVLHWKKYENNSNLAFKNISCEDVLISELFGDFFINKKIKKNFKLNKNGKHVLYRIFLNKTNSRHLITEITRLSLYSKVWSYRISLKLSHDNVSDVSEFDKLIYAVLERNIN